MSRDHQQYEDNVGAYLLGALPELEAEVFARHLEGCTSCRLEYERLRVAADALPRAVEPVEPPAELKESLMRTVLAEAAARAEAPAATPWWRRPFLPRLPRLTPALAGAVAACLLGIGVGIGIGVAPNGGGARTVAALVDHSRAPTASASLHVPSGARGAVLTVRGLPQPGAGKVYEVWVQRSGHIRPAGALFSVASDGNGSAGIPGSLHGVQAVAVTAERDGGTQQPTQSPLITVKLT